ncbi:MAG TPA: hypothetical protein VGR70_20415 [Stellaceae bacterium]|nr:hypothetical protein [Stellaceae bacterium]
MYAPLRAAAGYVASVVAVTMTLILIGVLIPAIYLRPPLRDCVLLLLSGLLDTLLSILIFSLSLLLVAMPFYLLLRILARRRVRNVVYFVLGGGLAGGMLIAGLLAAGSVISVSGAAFWRAPQWMWAVFILGGGMGGFVFWLVDIWPHPRRLLGRS